MHFIKCILVCTWGAVSFQTILCAFSAMRCGCCETVAIVQLWPCLLKWVGRILLLLGCFSLCGFFQKELPLSRFWIFSKIRPPSLFVFVHSVLLYSLIDRADCLGQWAQDGHLDFHTAPESVLLNSLLLYISSETMQAVRSCSDHCTTQLLSQLLCRTELQRQCLYLCCWETTEGKEVQLSSPAPPLLSLLG